MTAPVPPEQARDGLSPICSSCDSHEDGSFTCDPSREQCPHGICPTCGRDVARVLLEAHLEMHRMRDELERLRGAR